MKCGDGPLLNAHLAAFPVRNAHGQPVMCARADIEWTAFRVPALAISGTLPLTLTVRHESFNYVGAGQDVVVDRWCVHLPRR